MSKRVSVSLAIAACPICLALQLLIAPKIAYVLLALSFVGVPLSALLIGSAFIAGGVLYLLRDPVTGLILN